MMNLEDLNSLDKQLLLKTPLSSINFNLRSTPLMRAINDLKFELNEKGINFFPQIWVSSDWFSPDGVAGFAIPFYLLHPRLIKLEKTNTNRVEGHTYQNLMKLLRHETAHAIDNAFHLRKLKARQSLFGTSKTKYPKSYLPDPNNKDYVQNLDEYYAQAHPDEDWAETFAIWLNPKVDWQTKYKKWGAIKKLSYLDSVMESIKHQPPKSNRLKKVECVSKDNRTLQQYYKDRRKELRINRTPTIHKSHPDLSTFIQAYKADSKKIVTSLTGNQFVTNKFIRELSRAKSSNQSLNLIVKRRKCLEKELELLSLQYIKSGEYKVIM